MANTDADNAENLEWERREARANRCQCFGDMPGRCHGPANCPMCQDDRPEDEDE